MAGRFFDAAREAMTVHVWERLRGETYWLPTDQHDIAPIPKHQLRKNLHEATETQEPLSIRKAHYAGEKEAIYHVCLHWTEPEKIPSSDASTAHSEPSIVKVSYSRQGLAKAESGDSVTKSVSQTPPPRPPPPKASASVEKPAFTAGPADGADDVTRLRSRSTSRDRTPTRSSHGSPARRRSPVKSTSSADSESGGEETKVKLEMAEGYSHELSLFRSKELQEARDVYQTCLAAKPLFMRLESLKELERLMGSLREHSLWQAVHIAALLGLKSFFNRFEARDGKLMKMLRTAAQPEGAFPLHIAVERNHVELVEVLVGLGADLTQLDVANDSTPLHYAADASAAMVDMLCGSAEGRAVVNTLNKDGYTPLFLALRLGNPLIMRALVRHGAEVNVRCKGRSPLCTALQVPPLFLALRLGNPLIMRALVRHGAEVNVRCKGRSPLCTALQVPPLFLALRLGNPLIMRALVRHGAEVNVRCKGRSPLCTALQVPPLFLALRLGNPLIMRALVRHGAEVNVRCKGRSPLCTALQVPPLFLALRLGNPLIMRALVRHGAEVNVRCKGRSPLCTALQVPPLFLALRLGNPLIMRALVRHGAEVNVRCKGRSPLCTALQVPPLFLALRLGNPLIMRALVRHGAEVNVRCKGRSPLCTALQVPPLFLALRLGNPLIMRALVRHGAEVNVRCKGRSPLCTALQVPPLFLALRLGNPLIMRALVRHGAEVNVRCKGRSPLCTALQVPPLFLALRLGNPLIMRALVRHGAEVNVRCKGRSPLCTALQVPPLFLALRLGNPLIMRALVRHGAEVNVRCKGRSPLCTALQVPPLFLALRLGNPLIMRALVRHGAEVNVRCKGRSPLCTALQVPPLFLALRLGNPLIMRALVRHGAEVNVRCKGRSPLCTALQDSNSQRVRGVVASLVEANPEVVMELEEKTGNSALHSAAGKEALGALLLCVKDPSALVNLRNSSGQTALHMHAARNDLGAVMTLASYGADVNAEDGNRNTALHYAASKGNLTMVRILLLLGGSPNALNASKDSPRHLASKLAKTNEHSTEKKKTTSHKLQDRITEIVTSLEMVGGKRCGPGKVGCRSLCVAQAGQGGLASQASSISASSVPSDEETPASSSTEMAQVKREANSKRPEPSKPLLDELREFRQEKLIDNLKRQVFEAGGPSKLKLEHLISMDGGGIRGLVIIQILMGLEKALGRPLWPYMDWTAGTSTGSYIAAGMALGKSLRQCQFLYLRFKDQIFEGGRPYKTAQLEDLLQKEMGEGTLADIERPRLLITATKANRHPMHLELFRNYRLPEHSEEENLANGYLDPSELPLWQVLRASSAAPTYFGSVDNTYLDGGLVANNPAQELLSELSTHNDALEMRKSKEARVRPGVLISIGTGQIPDVSIDNLDVTISSSPLQAYSTLRNLGLMMVEQLTAAEGCPVERSRSLAHASGVPFFRFSAPMSKDLALDTRDDHDLVQLIWDAETYVRNHQAEITALADLLKELSGPRP